MICDTVLRCSPDCLASSAREIGWRVRISWRMMSRLIRRAVPLDASSTSDKSTRRISRARWRFCIPGLYHPCRLEPPAIGLGHRPRRRAERGRDAEVHPVLATRGRDDYGAHPAYEREEALHDRFQRCRQPRHDAECDGKPCCDVPCPAEGGQRHPPRHPGRYQRGRALEIKEMGESDRHQSDAEENACDPDGLIAPSRDRAIDQPSAADEGGVLAHPQPISFHQRVCQRARELQRNDPERDERGQYQRRALCGRRQQQTGSGNQQQRGGNARQGLPPGYVRRHRLLMQQEIAGYQTDRADRRETHGEEETAHPDFV